ncbi:agmatine deiminase family protein [Streptomyces sp. BHT-5-2]|uniref:agmatine deiminase family protein n=1 Tax=Streptomyces sp. BHT-5-2 TaxID=2866715 RepID=UPI0021B128B2|nr:agmatine deiminase family protein [Streptomyces sp. BHT-5-2]
MPARMRAGRAVLKATTDARGRAPEIVELPQTAYGTVDGEPVEVGCLDFSLANGGAVVPVGADGRDEEARAVLAAALPGRRVVGEHRITPQLPRAPRTR